RLGLEAAHDTATCEAANGLISGEYLGNHPDIAAAQIEQFLQGLHESLPSVAPSRLQANLLYLERVQIAATASAARLPTPQSDTTEHIVFCSALARLWPGTTVFCDASSWWRWEE